MSVKIFVVREDLNGDSPTLGDIVTIPSEIFNRRCDADNYIQFFSELTHRFKKQDDLPAKDLTIRDFFKLPADYLAEYGVTIEPIDTVDTLHVHEDMSLHDWP